MNNQFKPTIRKAPSTPVAAAQSTSAHALAGMSLNEVIQACQWQVTAGKGKDRAATGDTFLNMLTPKVFVAEPESNELHALPQIYANFDNIEDSVAVQLAEFLSTELLNKGAVPELQYFFKLIDSTTKATIATDMPEYAPREESTNDLPDFLKPDAAAQLANAYVPPAGVCAFLHIYAEQNGRPVRIASSDIPSRFSANVAQAAKLAQQGYHFQAGVVPQTKVVNWLNDQAIAQDIKDNIDINDFSVATQS